MIQFRRVDLFRDMPICIKFREDSYRSSFPDDDDWKQFWSEDEYRLWLVKHASKFPDGVWHIWKEKQIIDQLEFAYLKETGHVNLYYLAPQVRRKGYGTIAHEHTISWLKVHGCKSATLRVSLKNIPAIEFYKRVGWVDLGKDPDYSHMRTFKIDL